MNEDDYKVILLLVKQEYGVAKRNGQDKAWARAIECVAEGLEMAPNDVRSIVNTVLRERARKAKESRETIVEGVPRGSVIDTDIFELEDIVVSMSKDLRGVAIGKVVRFICSSFEEAKKLQSAVSRATSKAKWKSYQSRIVGEVLYVRRGK